MAKIIALSALVSGCLIPALALAYSHGGLLHSYGCRGDSRWIAIVTLPGIFVGEFLSPKKSF